MKKINGYLLLSSMLLLLPFFLACGDDDDDDNDDAAAAELVVTNATIFTADPDQPWAEALAIRDGRFVYVGDESGVQALIGKDTKQIDGEGNWVTPGFVDNHCHVVWMGSLMALMTSLYGLDTLADVVEEIRSYADSVPTLPFVMGIGWTLGQIPGGVLPDAAMADDILADRPLFLWGEGGHAGWVNTLALNLMRERSAAAFQTLVPQVDDEGNPTGFLNHFYKFNPFDFFTQDEIGEDGLAAMAVAVQEVLAEALTTGVTTMNDIQIYQTYLPFVEQFQQAGVFEKTRIRMAYFIEPSMLDNEETLLENLTAWRTWGAALSDEHLIAGESVKLYIDGVPGNHTAFLSEPYTDAPDEYGEPEWSAAEFDRVVALADDLGLQIHTHGIGDAGIARIIDSYRHAAEENGAWDARHSVEHCEMIQDADIPRMAANNIYASMQPSHFFGNDENCIQVIGQARTAAMMPWGSLEDAGVNLTFGSDWVAAPINPFYGLIIAATRMNYLGEQNWQPEDAVDFNNALTHYTVDSARMLKMEDDIGSIRVGKLGDFVLFSIDLSQIITPAFLEEYGFEIGSLDHFVTLTAVGGEVVYEAE